MPNPLTPMTPTERALALRLSPARITYLPASADKRFARQMAELAEGGHGLITDKQREYLYRLEHKYRRQLEQENA